jgi:hypothetical protein
MVEAELFSNSVREGVPPQRQKLHRCCTLAYRYCLFWLNDAQFSSINVDAGRSVSRNGERYDRIRREDDRSGQEAMGRHRCQNEGIEAWVNDWTSG